MKRGILRGATVAVAATIMATSMSLASPITVEAKVRNTGKNITAFVEIPEYVDDDYIPPAGYKVVDNKVVPIDGGAPINNTSIPASTTAATPAAVSDFNLNATWTYLENSANNPVPVMVEQSPNVWVVAMYQGTSAVFGVNQNYGAGMIPTVVSTATGCAAAAGNEAGIIIAANTVGTDMLTYQLVNPQAGAPATATTVTIAVSVVPAAPGTGNGVMTNVGTAQATPAVTTGNTTTTAKTDREKAQEMLKLINAERAKLGRGPLTIHNELQANTDRRAKEICNDFRHTDDSNVNTDTIISTECITTNMSSGISASAALRNFKNSKVHWNAITSSERSIVGISFHKGCCVVLPGAYREIEEDDMSWNVAY